ncbi:MAG: TIGR04295 family B12-binding domain-containing radical SAM protein [Alphaproteobacteria bacterium]|nr:TIGR04295 family B12-binding domain-containing radical SAM protein [Alphaproteobacteria bacterium]
MRVALVNPRWDFAGSIYFGCREPHLPLELGCAKVLLEAAGHAAEIIDAHLFNLGPARMAAAVTGCRPDMIVMTTAPSYLFWRCAPPELRVPQEALAALGGAPGLKVAVGPHGSTTPRATLAKLPVDIVVMGECEEVLVDIANGRDSVAGTAVRGEGGPRIFGGPRLSRFTDLAPLAWGDDWIHRHRHHHHRFDAPPDGPGAEVEASRGCPYRCTFCAKETHRDVYRRRALAPLLAEIDRLIAQGVEYLYFIDEIFLPNRPLLAALADRRVRFGVQTRIDLWKPDMIRLLGEAGCVSVEAGIESLSPEGRDMLDKDCRLTTEQLGELLVLAKRHIRFVQANLIEMPHDDQGAVDTWRETLRGSGVRANDPVPLFPYPGSPDYRRLWGDPDDRAWERAVDYYIARFARLSDVQSDRPLPLRELEHPAA